MLSLFIWNVGRTLQKYIHPTSFCRTIPRTTQVLYHIQKYAIMYERWLTTYRSLAQFGRALALGARGRKFKSFGSDQYGEWARHPENPCKILACPVRVRDSPPYVRVAQLAEHCPPKSGVVGSTPTPFAT